MHMKKVFTLAIIALLASSAFATEVTINFTTNAGVRALGLTPPRSEQKVFLTAPVTQEGVTLSTATTNTYIILDDEDDMYLYLHAYAAVGDQSATLSVADGYEIKSVEIKYTTKNYINRLTVDSGTLTDYLGGTSNNLGFGTWEGAAQSVTFTAPAGKMVMIDYFTVTYEPKTVTGINDVEAKTVKAVRYYNLQGVESANPFDGINIKVEEMTDGSKVATKVLK